MRFLDPLARMTPSPDPDDSPLRADLMPEGERVALMEGAIAADLAARVAADVVRRVQREATACRGIPVDVVRTARRTLAMASWGVHQPSPTAFARLVGWLRNGLGTR